MSEMTKEEATDLVRWMGQLFPNATIEQVKFIGEKLVGQDWVISRRSIETHREESEFLNPAKLIHEIRNQSAGPGASPAERREREIKDADKRRIAMTRANQLRSDAAKNGDYRYANLQPLDVLTIHFSEAWLLLRDKQGVDDTARAIVRTAMFNAAVAAFHEIHMTPAESDTLARECLELAPNEKIVIPRWSKVGAA